MPESSQLLEDALAATEQDTETALRAARAVIGQLAKARKAAANGALRELERALESAQELAGALSVAVDAARRGWRFDDHAYLESGAYAKELVEVARTQQLALREQDGRLVAFPSLIRVLAPEGAIEIDRKKLRQIRPSAVVDAVRAAQTRPPRFRPERFLEALLRGYRLVLAEQRKEQGATVPLVDVHRVLTVLPDVAYSRQEFTRDVYLLDESAVGETRDGLRVSLSAATGTKGARTLTTVGRDGSVRFYYGIAFS